MYRIVTSNSFFNGLKFDSMVEAIEKAKELKEKYPQQQFDVMHDLDRETTRVVWASACIMNTHYPASRPK